VVRSTPVITTGTAPPASAPAPGPQ
jgi:hypothetical protein